MTPRPLLAAAVVSTAAALPLALVVAPPDAVQGEAQRFMYLHVPAAWGAYLCFGVVALSSLLSIVRGRGDAVARASAEVGVVLTALTLVTGTVWGALTWGTWWAWDARIMTTAVMGLFYVAYLSCASLARSAAARRATAVLGAAGVLFVPIVHFSVVWWRTLHQPPTLLAPGTGTPIDPLMGIALASCVLTMTLWVAVAVLARAAARRATARTTSTTADVDERAEMVGA